MSNPADSLQKAIRARLVGDDGVKAKVESRVFDDVPPNARFPYLVIGDCQLLDTGDDCADRSEIIAQIHGWSRSVGFAEVNEIADLVRRAMKADLAVEGFVLDVQQLEQILPLRDPDPKTRHAVIEYRFELTHNDA